MKTLLLSFATILMTSSFASAALKEGQVLRSSSRSAVHMTVLTIDGEGTPTTVGFVRGGRIITFGNITSSKEPIDILEGELYNLTGPQRETELCNLSAKVAFEKEGVRIFFDQADVGTQFFKSCFELLSITGTYK